MHDPSQLGDSRLVRWLIDRIEASGRNAISFKSFMEACLYHPRCGYYMQDKERIGKKGDFYTSVSLGSIMGEMLAVYFADHFRRYSDESVYAIVEWGAGSGKLAADIAAALKASAPQVYRKLRYTLLDASPRHRRLHEELAEAHPGIFTVADPAQGWALPLPRGAIVFGNELLDAFPVHRLVFKDGQFQEQYVTWNGNAFEPVLVPDLPDAVEAYLREHGVQGREGQTVEVNLEADAWIGKAASHMAEGLLLLIDYGGRAEELYASHRQNGTLMCYRQHAAHDDPFRHVGEQDITAHVNFSACISSGLAAGFTSYALSTQKQFLLDLGLLDRLIAHAHADPFHPLARRNRAIRQLLLDDGMGELFKVLTLHKTP